MEWNNTLTILSLLIYKYYFSLHLFRASLISLSSFVLFSTQIIYTHFVKFISKYFISLDDILNGILKFQFLIVSCELLEIQFIIVYYPFILWPCSTCLLGLIPFLRVLWMVISSANKESFTYSFPICRYLLFMFVCLWSSCTC